MSAQANRSGKASNHKPDAKAEVGPRAIVPVKQPNKEAQASAEVVEGKGADQGERRRTRHEPDTGEEQVSQGLSGVREVARRGSRNGSRLCCII